MSFYNARNTNLDGADFGAQTAGESRASRAHGTAPRLFSIQQTPAERWESRKQNLKRGLVMVASPHTRGRAWFWAEISRCVECGREFFNGESLPKFKIQERGFTW